MRLGRTIAFIHHSTRSESSVDIGRGVEAAAAMVGCEVTVYDPDFDQHRRRAMVEEAVASEPDVIIAAVVSPTLLPDLFDVVAAKGIPWIEAGAQQDWARGLTVQAVPDEREMTSLLDIWMIERLAQRHGVATEAPLGAWIASALGAGLAQRDETRRADLTAHPHVREVFTHDIVLGDLESDVRTSTMAALEAHPDLRALWQTCEPCVATQARTLDELGRSGDDRPVLAGFYSNPSTRELIAGRGVDGLVQVDTRVQGLAAVDFAVRHWTTGEPWPTSGVNAMESFSETLGRPWMVTSETVGPDPSRLQVPGPDPVEFFADRWSGKQS